MKAKRININCYKCGTEIQRSVPAVYKAKKLGRNIYCKKCHDEMHYVGISLDDAIKIKGTKLWKGKVRFTCKICNENVEYRYSFLVKRKYGRLEPICKKCILKYAANTNEWRSINSAAQFVAQNKPEQKIKNSLAVKEACKRHDVIERKRAAMKKLYWGNKEYRKKNMEHLKNLHSNYEVIEKQQLHNRFISGYVVIKNEKIFFNSGWELAFIRYCVNNGYLISRCKEGIPYEYNGEMHLYFPDFVVVKNGRKIIVEIKGRYTGSSELVKPKMDAAISFIKKSCKYDDYMLYCKDELIKAGIDISRSKIKELKREADKSYEDYKKGLSRESI